MGEIKNLYFEDNYMEVVEVRDGRPVRYCSVARRSREDEPMLIERIKKLTGFTVRFGEWEQFEPVGRDFQSASEVDLVVVDG